MAEFHNPAVRYFHVDEMLRSSFYEPPGSRSESQGKLRLLSTIAASTYKGIDVVLGTAARLKELRVKFEWTVAGIAENDPMLRYFAAHAGVKPGRLGLRFPGGVPKAGSCASCINIPTSSSILRISTTAPIAYARRRSWAHPWWLATWAGCPP